MSLAIPPDRNHRSEPKPMPVQLLSSASAGHAVKEIDWVHEVTRKSWKFKGCSGIS